MRNLNIPLVIIGKYRDDKYYKQCVAQAPPESLFIDSLYYHSDIMRSALQECMFFIESSHEPAGISAIEAGLSGCDLILSDMEWSREHFGEYATYVSPDSVKSIQDGITLMLENKNKPRGIHSSLLHHLSGTNIKLLHDVFSEF